MEASRARWAALETAGATPPPTPRCDDAAFASRLGRWGSRRAMRAPRARRRSSSGRRGRRRPRRARRSSPIPRAAVQAQANRGRFLACARPPSSRGRRRRAHHLARRPSACRDRTWSPPRQQKASKRRGADASAPSALSGDGARARSVATAREGPTPAVALEAGAVEVSRRGGRAPRRRGRRGCAAEAAARQPRVRFVDDTRGGGHEAFLLDYAQALARAAARGARRSGGVAEGEADAAEGSRFFVLGSSFAGRRATERAHGLGPPSRTEKKKDGASRWTRLFASPPKTGRALAGRRPRARRLPRGRAKSHREESGAPRVAARGDAPRANRERTRVQGVCVSC